MVHDSDSILGAFRQWWVPSGMSARDGAYVYVDHEALLGILALEADRAGAILIGEDLGVFESEVVKVLKERSWLLH